MATATTAVAALKFADTLDITLLTPEQIAKFTDKDFAAFSTQQQVDLTASQVGLLTAKQIAALPFKLLEPNTITGIQPKVLSALDLKTLSADQFAALLPAQVQALTPLQITNLTTAQVDALAPEQTAVLTSAQVTAFTDKSLKVLSEFALEALSVDAIKGLTPANIIGLTTDSIKILTVDQVAALKADQVKALTPALVAAMEAEDLAALTPDAVKGFNVKAIPSLEINALTPEQLAVLTPKQMSSFTATQLGLLDETYAPVFNARVLALLSTAQVNAMSTAIVNALDPLAVKGFTVKNIKGLSTDQLAVITPEQGVNLSKSQLGSLDATKVSSLPSEVIVELKPQVLKSLPVNIIANLSAGAFAAFTDVQIAGLGSKQIAGLTTSQAASLTSEHIQKFTPTAFKNLSDSSISALSASALAGLTSKQITGLTTAQLEKMTPAQVAQFAQELKDWAVTTKRYATVESAETAIATAQGIKTGGTVTGTARAETVTSGAANDTVTYTGTPTAGDKISTGAGDDLITVNDAAHTIDGGTGNDTLTFDDATPTLTNVTGVERIILANTNAQSFDAGTGTNNALISLTATAIADDTALTLTGSVANLPVSLTNGNLSATGYTAKLVVSAAGTNAKTIVTGTGNDSITTGNGANSVEGGTGNDTIVAGTGDDTIKGQAGVDSVTGGTGADIFVIAASDNGAAPSDSVFDTIVDFGTGSDILDFSSALSIQAQSTAATTSVAQISQAGKVTFHANTTSLADKITAVEGGINAGGNTAGEAALFTHGSDAYIFISDGTSGVASTDVLIKLEGDATTSKALVIDSTGTNAGNLTSVTGYAATADFSSVLADSVVHVTDTAAAISTALSTGGSNLLLGIAAGKIDSITASDGLPIVLAPSKFAQTGVAALLDTGSVNIGSTTSPVVSGAMSANPSSGYTSELNALNTYASKIATDGILSAVTGLTLDRTQFDTLVSKLASTTTVTVDATSATTAQLATISSNISNIITSGITNLSIPQVDATVTDSVVDTLLTKATAANVVITSATATEIASLITYKNNIATGATSPTGISGTVPTLTATQFKDLGSKIADTVTAAVTLTTTEGTTSAVASAIVADIANISGITTSDSAKLALTDTQFAALGTDFSKLAAGMANVDAAGATTAELTAISDGITGTSKVNSITNLTLTVANVGDTVTSNLLGKATSASIVATDASATEVTSIITNVANIAANGITGTITLTDAEFGDLYAKLNTSASITVSVSGSTAALDKADILANLSKIDTFTGTGFTVTAAEFATSGFVTKLASSGISVIVNASGASTTNLKALSDVITSNPSVVSSITGLSLSLGTDYVGDGHASTANDVVTSNLLSKATAATVDAQNETAAELISLSTYSGNISTISNSANTVSAAEFVANVANLPTGVVVDAASASEADLRGIITAASSKLGSIKNLTVNTQVHSDSDLTYLLGKAQNGSVTVSASWAPNASVTVLADVINVTKIKDGGITGNGMAMTPAQFGTLGAKISSSVSDLTINASGATQAALASVSNYAARVALINNLTIDLGDTNITNTVAENLLSRSAMGTNAATVTVTGATSTELNSVATHIDNVLTPTAATDGIKGVLSIDQNIPAANITALFSKHFDNNTAVANVSGMSTAQITAVVAADAKMAASGITGSVTGMSAAQLTALVSGANVATTVGGLTGVLALDSGVAAADILKLHTAYSGSTASAVITGMSDTQITNLDTTEIATGGITGSVASMNAAALTALAGKATDIAANSLTGTLAIDSGVANTDITTLFGKYAGTTATANTTSMTGAQLAAVAGGVAKIQASGITNLSSTNFILDDTAITGTVAADLLSKATTGISADASSASTADAATDEITALATYATKFSTSGILNTAALTATATQFNALSSKLASTIKVNAEGATAAELTAISTNNTKVTALGLSNLTVTSSQTTTEITNLLTLAPTGTPTAKVSATSMTAAQLAAISAASAITHVSLAGITGVMAVTEAAGDATGIGALFTAYSGTTATADITGMISTEIDALDNNKISSGGISGAVTGLDAAAITSLATKKVDVTDGTLTGTATVTNTQYTALGSKLANTVSIVASDATQTASTLNTMNAATSGFVDASAATALSGSVADVKAAVVTADGSSGNTIGHNAAVAITLSDAVGTAIAATDLSAIGNKTTGTVTATNAIAISGTASEVTDALVTTASLVVAGSATVTVSDATTVSIINAIDAKTSGVITATISSSPISTLAGLTGTGNAYAVTVSDAATIAELTTLDGKTTGTITYGTVADAAATLATNTGSYVTGSHAVTATDTGTVNATDLITIDGLTTGLVNATAAATVSGTGANVKTVVVTNQASSGDKIDTSASALVTVTDSGSITATTLSDINGGTTGLITATSVTTLTGTTAEIVAVTDAMAASGDKIALAGLTTLQPSNAVSATSFNGTAFTQASITISLANVASNALTVATGTVASGNTLKFDGTAITTAANGFTFDGAAETDGTLSVTGGAGNDTITGGAGVDTLVGGSGNDIFNYSSTADLILTNAVEDSVEGGTGTDEIKLTTASGVTVGASDILTRINDVEKITAGVSVGAISLTLNATNLASTEFTTIDLSGDTDATNPNVIDVSGAVSISTIIGSTGVDTITIGASAPATTVTGGAAADTLSIATTNAVTITDAMDVTPSANSATTLAASTGAAVSVAAGSLTSAALNLSGAGAFTVTGYASTGTLTDSSTSAISVTLGSVATTTLALGSDTTGTDTVVGGSLTDGQVLTMTGANDATVSLTAGDLSASAYTGALTVTATTGATGNVITTGSGADNIDAGADADTITASDGNDTITGGTGADDIDVGTGANTVNIAVADAVRATYAEVGGNGFGDLDTFTVTGGALDAISSFASGDTLDFLTLTLTSETADGSATSGAYQVIRGGYVEGASSVFTVNATGTDSLVLWHDGTNVDNAVVLVGVTSVSGITIG